MEELLYLAHRIPYPPNKGDKLRSYHEVAFLARQYRVHVGAFADDPADLAHVDALARLAGGEVCVLPLDARLARLASVCGLATGEALSLPYYRWRRLAAWVDDLLARRPVRKAVTFSSPMAQYLLEHSQITRVADFVDVDSAKWRQYAAYRRGPAAWVYRREADKLLAFERRVAREFTATLLVAPHEAALLRELAPESAQRIHHAANGVDADYFSPEHRFASPFVAGERAIVFTGAMDYWPNVDAVEWFADEVFPAVRGAHPEARFCIVGARPLARLQRLAGTPGISVIGAVPDVRPYLAHATLAVAPLRIARGIQNKVLEAMAMGKTTVASPGAAEGIDCLPGRELLIADSAGEWREVVSRVLHRKVSPDIGAAARARVLANYSWQANLSRLAALIANRDTPGESAPANAVAEERLAARASA